jgi:hypothetical protein
VLLSTPLRDSVLVEPSADTSLRRSKWSRHRYDARRADDNSTGPCTKSPRLGQRLKTSLYQSLRGRSTPKVRVGLQLLVEEAKRGAEDTAQMMPRMGRSSYLGDRVLGHPDPGAKAAAIWLDAVAGVLSPEEQYRSDAEVFDRKQLLARLGRGTRWSFGCISASGKRKKSDLTGVKNELRYQDFD